MEEVRSSIEMIELFTKDGGKTINSMEKGDKLMYIIESTRATGRMMSVKARAKLLTLMGKYTRAILRVIMLMEKGRVNIHLVQCI